MSDVIYRNRPASSTSRRRSRSRSVIRRSASTESQPYLCLVPVDLLGSVTETTHEVDKIAKKTGAALKLNSQDHVKDLVDVVMSIKGTLNQKEDAIFEVIDYIRYCLKLADSDDGMFVMLIPEGVAPMIIGRKGATIREIREDSRCDVTLDEDPVKGTRYRAITLRGKFRETKSAVRLIQRIIDDYVTQGRLPKLHFDLNTTPAISPVTTPSNSRDSAVHYPCRIMISSDCAGFLIGRNGSSLLRIREKSHADVLVSKNVRGADEDRFVIIRGHGESRTRATDLVIEGIREHCRVTSDDSRAEINLVVPEESASLIIGKQGKTIGDMRSDFDASVDIEERNIRDTRDRKVRIKANLKNTMRIAEKISRIVDEVAERKGMRPDDFDVPGYVNSRK